MRTRRIMATAAATVLVAVAGMLTGATSASAADTDQIWYQSVGSPSQDAPCPESDAADLAKGWTPWVKGYEDWPNDGKGGWTCGRSILWAKGSPAPSSGDYPSIGCALADIAYYDFLGGWSLPALTGGFSDAACTNPTSAYLAVPAVYAPVGWDASDLCLDAFGLPVSFGPYGDDLYGCRSS
jgi:hypothetical protein